MDRRTHIKTIAGMAGAVVLGSSSKTFAAPKPAKAASAQGKVMTVTGAVSPAELGLTLPHEYIFSNFGKEAARYPSYPEKKLMDTVIPYLKKLKKLGVKTIVDSTAAYTGRHPEFLRKISKETGVQLITNTGYFGASEGKYIPEHVADESSDEVADRWISEINKGIDETGVYPGYIITALEHKPLLKVDNKLIEAAAKAHKETGLPIQTTTGDNIYAANESISILSDNGINAEAWTWINANMVTNPDNMLPIAKMGAFISYDGLAPENAERFLNDIKLFKEEGLLHKILLSHSGISFKTNGSGKDFHFLVTDFKPRFLAYGFSEEDFKQITETNPANALTIKKRLL